MDGMHQCAFLAASASPFERSMLRFAGIKPVRESLYGLAFADEKKRPRWIEEMHRREANEAINVCW